MNALPHAVVAVVARGERILMIRRGEHGPDPGFWGPPSGKIETGETQEDAVQREVLEEVGLHVTPRQKLGECVSSNGTHLLHWWLVEAPSDELVVDAREVSEAKWVDEREIVALEPRFGADGPLLERAFHSIRKETTDADPHRETW